jgi:hypothetical protein
VEKKIKNRPQKRLWPEHCAGPFIFIREKHLSILQSGDSFCAVDKNDCKYFFSVLINEA